MEAKISDVNLLGREGLRSANVGFTEPLRSPNDKVHGIGSKILNSGNMAKISQHTGASFAINAGVRSLVCQWFDECRFVFQMKTIIQKKHLFFIVEWKSASQGRRLALGLQCGSSSPTYALPRNFLQCIISVIKSTCEFDDYLTRPLVLRRPFVEMITQMMVESIWYKW